MCPGRTYQSVVKDLDNVTVIGVCVDCAVQCAACVDSSSCTNCNPSGNYKY